MRRNLHSKGYWRVQLPGGDWMLEHRYVMSLHLGRPLSRSESVHHLDGNRLNNELSNLELWSTAQPAGQRVADKIDYALDILRTYAPEMLA